MSTGFDRIAPYYDLLARIVFGKSIRRCQIEYLDIIPAEANVLILGGGTGWLLAELLKENPTCRVWYVEASIIMLEKAKRRNEELSRVSFIHGTERDINQIAGVRFDAVFTNFYLDLFTSGSLDAALMNIKRAIRPGGKLLVSEFVERKRWQRLLLFVMYRFFRWTCSIEASRLPDWQNALRRNDFKERETKAFFYGFIKSSWYLLD